MVEKNMECNREIKIMMAMNGIKQTEIAAKMQIYPQSVSRMLKTEMPEVKKEAFIRLIEIIKKEKASYDQGTRMGICK